MRLQFMLLKVSNTIVQFFILNDNVLTLFTQHSIPTPYILQLLFSLNKLLIAVTEIHAHIR
jgi:hypothetical protein